MRLKVLRALSAVCLTAPLFGCGSLFDEPRAAWRHEVEARCLASGRVSETDFVKREKQVDGPGSCGADTAFRVFAALRGTVWVNEPALMNCPMTAAFDDWLNEVVQPNAMAVFGQPVSEIRTFGTYSCRKIRGGSFLSMSEHAYLNAVDIAAFRLGDGREVTILRDWNTSDPAVRQFLRRVGAESCKIFTTVLGPPANAEHRDHLHLDLANRSRGGRHICRAGEMPAGPMSYGQDDITSSIGGKPSHPIRSFENLEN